MIQNRWCKKVYRRVITLTMIGIPYFDKGQLRWRIVVEVRAYNRRRHGCEEYVRTHCRMIKKTY